MVVRGLKPRLPGCPLRTAGMGEPRALALSMKSLLFGGNQESREAQVASHFPALSTLLLLDPMGALLAGNQKKCQLRY